MSFFRWRKRGDDAAKAEPTPVTDAAVEAAAAAPDAVAPAAAAGAAPMPEPGDAKPQVQSVETVVDTAPPAVQPVAAEPAPAAEVEVLGRMSRLRGRIRGGLGRGLLGVLTGASLSEADWEDAEALLLQADLGVEATQRILADLRRAVREHGDVRMALRTLLLRELRTDRSLELDLSGSPAVIMVVGVNGTGKTTTCGKLAAALRGLDRTVVLGAADTFRAAAAQQLQTWGDRVGATVVRGPEQGDPASVAFDTITRAVDAGVDVAIIDTAGRLHTKVGLMDELGKVKRVAAKVRPVDEVLLVLDATTGQNGLTQARVFAEAVQVTGVVLTKLDGTAKGGIVFTVQQQLGVPVKFVGLGEGADDLAPFDPEVFVDALLS